MTLRVGRAVLDDPFAVRFDGRRLSIDNAVEGASLAEALAIRQQLAGLDRNPWELVFPVSWDVDPTVDGFYRLAGTPSIGTVDASYTGFWFPASLTLERVGVDGESLLEATLRGSVRYNVTADLAAVDSAESTPWHAVSAKAVGYSYPSARHVRPSTIDGSAVHVRVPASQAFYNERVSYRIAPDDHYRAAATLTVDGWPVVGDNTVGPGAWAMTNDLLSVGPGVDALLSLSVPRLYRMTADSALGDTTFGFVQDTSQNPTGVGIAAGGPVIVRACAGNAALVGRMGTLTAATGDDVTFTPLDELGVWDAGDLAAGDVVACPIPTSAEYDVGYYNGSAFVPIPPSAIVARQVLGNSPEFAAWRLVCSIEPTAGTLSTVFVDVGLRRGALVADLSVRSETARKWGVRPYSAVACTVLDAVGASHEIGLRRSSNGTDGNRFVLLATSPHTVDTSTGVLYSVADALARDFGLGVELDGSNAATLDTAANLAIQWVAATTETTYVRTL